MNLGFPFQYEFNPTLVVTAFSPLTGQQTSFDALVDTGADRTLLDVAIADDLGIDLSRARAIRVTGIGGDILDVRSAPLQLFLLGELSLAVTITAAFAPRIATTVRNLLGLDVLEAIDFGLSHAKHTGYLGAASP